MNLEPSLVDHFSQRQIVLGSRSPRRRELLHMLVPTDRIEVRPPSSTEELSFDGLTAWLDIAKRLQQIARNKSDDILNQLTAEQAPTALVLTADTTIVATDALGCLRVLGQPPDDESWRDVVRGWFRNLYKDRSHIAATAICLTDWPSGRRVERIVQSHVWMQTATDELVDWYLTTGEPLGKAGGYALQGLGSLFVSRVEGSITNVVGLPLEALAELLPQFGWSRDSLGHSTNREAR